MQSFPVPDQAGSTLQDHRSKRNLPHRLRVHEEDVPHLQHYVLRKGTVFARYRNECKMDTTFVFLRPSTPSILTHSRFSSVKAAMKHMQTLWNRIGTHPIPIASSQKPHDRGWFTIANFAVIAASFPIFVTVSLDLAATNNFLEIAHHLGTAKGHKLQSKVQRSEINPQDFDKMELSREIVDEKSADVDVFLKAINDPSVISGWCGLL